MESSCKSQELDPAPILWPKQPKRAKINVLSLTCYTRRLLSRALNNPNIKSNPEDETFLLEAKKAAAETASRKKHNQSLSSSNELNNNKQNFKF